MNKCPFLMVNGSHPWGFEEENTDCIEKRCAWWVLHNYALYPGEQTEKGACALQFLGKAAQKK